MYDGHGWHTGRSPDEERRIALFTDFESSSRGIKDRGDKAFEIRLVLERCGYSTDERSGTYIIGGLFEDGRGGV